MGAETRECVSGGVFDGAAPSCERESGLIMMFCVKVASKCNVYPNVLQWTS